MRSPATANRPTAALLALLTSAVAASETIGVTPHDSYSSSVGVLGCKVNTNRIAYWPETIDCTNICVSLTYSGRSVYLLRIDQSGGAYDVSYDAWNYLITGESATEDPTAGGAVDMEREDVDVSKCASLLHASSDGSAALPLSASNSMNYLNSCLELQVAGNTSWVAEHYALYNIADPICSYGYDELCTLDDWPTQNQATCDHALGSNVVLDDDTPVYNIRYPTGELVLAASNEVASSSSASSTSSSNSPGLLATCWPLLGVFALLPSLLPWSSLLLS